MFTNPNTASGPKPVAAAVKISVSADAMQGRLFIEPPKYHGAEVTPTMIDEAIQKAKITFGIDMQLLQQIKAAPQYSRDYLIARGLPPVNGTDGSIKYCFTTKIDARPKVREDGTVDYRDLGIVVNVKRDQVLAEITLPTKGVEGMTITGRKIAPVPGKAIPSPVGRNTVLSPDGTKLLAALDGHVSLNGNRVNVVDTFIVPGDVNTSTGNINSVCNVSIVGSVLEGFSIEAAGNVDISHNVEGGYVKAGGNISIHGGVVGMGRSRIECNGNLNSNFFENCTVTAGGCVKTESIMNCNIKCTGNLELFGLRAKMMGGQFVVGGDVIANEIGSVSNLQTELILGATPAVMTRYSALAAEKKQLAEQIEKLKQIINLLDKYQQAGKLPMSKMRLLKNSQVSLDASIAKLDSATKEYDSLSGQIENSGKGKIVCKGTLYRGVKLTIGFASMVAENDIVASTFSLVDDKIVVTPAKF
jgi:uncharacterized protein (DUF342 family)